MAKKNYSVKEKEAHYKQLVDKSDQTKKQAVRTQKEARRVSYGAGYLQGVEDCREVLRQMQSNPAPKGKATK